MAHLKDENEEITGKLDAKYWVQKADPLVLMRSVPFSLGELKILDTYISRINATDDTRRTVIFTKEEYEELMGLTCANYRALEKNTDGLLGKVVTLEMPDKSFLKFVLFTKAHYHKDEYGKPIIELTCTEEARDLFFCIGKYHYFSYALENVIKLTHKSSYLLYLYIRQNRYRNEWEIELNELRENVLDCKTQQTYKEFKEFKKAVLAPAVKEINEKTDCHFEYEVVKRGRRVARIKFTYISGKEIESQDFNELPMFEPSSRKYSSDHIEFLAEAVNREFSDSEMKVLADLANTKDLSAYCHDQSHELTVYNYLSVMYHKLELFSQRRKIKDRFAYLKKIIEQDGVED